MLQTRQNSSGLSQNVHLRRLVVRMDLFYYSLSLRFSQLVGKDARGRKQREKQVRKALVNTTTLIDRNLFRGVNAYAHTHESSREGPSRLSVGIATNAFILIG